MGAGADSGAVRARQDILPIQPYGAVSREIAGVTLEPIRRRWLIGLAVSGILVLILAGAIVDLFIRGIGTWGVNIPNSWGIAIIDYVWWIGIGNAGTLISALLLLMREHWRNSLNRAVEAMTVFAASCAAMLPILHLGRPWLFYWTMPYPNPMGLWPQFRSPLVWDVFAVPIYLIVSILFWYIGMIPDMATVRDRSRRAAARVFYGILALGWRGSAIHWARWRQVYRVIAGLGVPLVVSVHSGVGLLYAVGALPGWHSTIFPPFFVFGAAYSGFAMALMIAIVLRHAFGLRSLITWRHLDILAKLILATGLMTDYGYVMEAFTAWYSGDIFERSLLMSRFAGDYAWMYWATIACNLVLLQGFWFKAVRRRIPLLFAFGAVGVLGMWFERLMLTITSTHHGFMTSAWKGYAPSTADWVLLAGQIGLYVFLFLMFVRLLPVVSIFEVKEVLFEQKRGA